MSIDSSVERLDHRRRPSGVRRAADHEGHRRRLATGWFTEDFTLAEPRRGAEPGPLGVAPDVIQSFETGNLRDLNRLSDVPLAHLPGPDHPDITFQAREDWLATR